MAPQPGRLYAKGLFTGFKRGLRNQHENTALVKVEGCEGKGDAEWYVGKRCAYVYKVRQIMIFLKFLNCWRRLPVFSKTVVKGQLVVIFFDVFQIEQ